MRKWELDLLQLKRAHMADIEQDWIIDRTPVIKIMAVILIIEICGAIKNNNGDIMVDITEIIGMV